MAAKKKHRHEWADGRCAAMRDGKVCGHKKPKKGVGGHPKGGRAEREVAGIIQTWWQRFETTAEFVRTPQSGGWGKARGKTVAAHFNACGDLMTTGARFPFCVEVKWRESWSYNNFTDGKPTPPWGWWRQTLDAAKLQGEVVPMMWMRKNRLRSSRDQFPWVVLVPRDYVINTRLSTPDIQWAPSQLKGNGVDYGGVLPCAYFYDRFLAMAPQRMANYEHQ